MNVSHQLAHQAERLLADSEPFNGVKGLAFLQQRLARSIEQTKRRKPERPVAIALIGGTGAGKSALFNALVGTPGASAVSDAERLFTREPHIAVVPSEASQLILPPEAKAVFVTTAVAGLALIDTPDLDGALPENREQARRMIELADILVYVALPEKRASFVVTKELERWTSRKHWFFVLNKIDLCAPSELGAIRNDFAQRIAELGFASTDSSLFLVSAKDPHHPYSELERLRSAIYSSRTSQEIQAFQEMIALQQFAHAVNAEMCGPLTALSHELTASEAALDQDAANIYLRMVSEPLVQAKLKEMLRARIWRQMPNRVGGFMGLPLWAVATLKQFWSSFDLSRSASAVVPIIDWVRSLLSATVAQYWGILPRQSLASAFRPDDLRELSRVRTDAIRKLEDVGIIWQQPAPPKLEQPTSAAAGWGEWLAGKMLALGSSDHITNQLLACLTAAVDRKAAEAATRSAGLPQKIFANLLPILVIADATRKLVQHWMNDVWLPGSFYLMVVFVYVVSTIPGCWMVSAAVRARSKTTNPQELLAELHEIPETAPLRETRQKLEIFSKKIGQFRQVVQEHHSALTAELPPDRFGARAEPNSIN